MIENTMSLELKGSLKSSKICQVISSISPGINMAKFSKFKTTNDFFKYYINKDLNSYLNDLNNININLALVCDDYYPPNATYIDKKISVITKIFVLSKLILNIQNIINAQLTSIKNYLFKIFYNNEFTREQNLYINLINLIENTTNIINNSNSKQRANSRKLTRESSSNQDISLNNFTYSPFRRNFDISTVAQNIIYDSNNNQPTGDQTPSFNTKNPTLKNSKSLNFKRVCKKESEEIPKEISNDEAKVKGSQISLTDLVFVVQKSKKDLNNIQKADKKEIKNLLNKNQKKNSRNSNQISKNKIKQSKSHSIEYKRIATRNRKTKVYGYLLEIIKSSYNNCYINAEEKFRLKRLIISKPRLIEEIYITFCRPGNNEKNKIIDYLKSYL